MRPSSPIALALIACGLMGLTGCMGTAVTRFIQSNEGDWAGEYPFKAVVWDVESIAAGEWRGSGHDAGPRSVWGIIALPWDIATDALLLPVDLILWPFGYHRK